MMDILSLSKTADPWRSGALSHKLIRESTTCYLGPKAMIRLLFLLGDLLSRFTRSPV